MKRILLIDDHPLTCTGLVTTLNAQRDLAVCGQAANAEKARDLADQLNPDLAIMEIALPELNGLELIEHLHKGKPKLGILVLTRLDEPLCAEMAIQAGARGFVSKHEPVEVLLEAVRHVLDGGFYVSEEINAQLLLDITSGGKLTTHSPSEVLSPRELEFFRLTGQGLGTRDIARRMDLSVKTVESYRSRTKKKLRLHTGSELIQHAVLWVEAGGVC